ncbi:GNAT family N-acetyltransferase [Leptothrix discophora]|uniref:GNAT family N-acetyltransferase n=1 Tax=Leptothrix discophora TaxID=89 RepID=A0ABT9G0A6_LEPDI|nr:GNAT family N-acetyltransferase [Leptothrix discophora]MDP4299911.1 GNAT family N-acetyltransferase [Leptothrix discophora]
MYDDKKWSFRVTQGTKGLQDLLEEWQALTDAWPEPARLEHLHMAEWARAYAHHLAPSPGRLIWASVRHGGRLVALLPLERTGRRSLRLLTNEHLYLADVVTAEDVRALWPALWRWLQHDAGIAWTRLEIGRLRADAWLAEGLRLCPPQRMFDNAVGGSADLDVDRSYDALLKSASANHRSSLGRGQKKAAALGTLRYESHATPQALAEALPHFMAVEVSGWKGEQGGAIACRPEWQAFYGELTQTLGTRGGQPGPRDHCEIDLLWLDDLPVATIFWLRTGMTLALQKIAYREDLAAVGPGKLILARALERACADPALRRISFITRCPWADGWRTQVTPVTAHIVYADHLRGRLAGRVRELARWAKAALKAWRFGRRPPATPPADAGPAGPAEPAGPA